MVKNILVSLFALVLIVVGAVYLQSTTAPSLAGTENGNVDQSVNNLKATGLVSSNGVQRFVKILTVNPGSNYAFWTNKTANTIYIDQGSVQTSGTASTSQKLYLIATSTNVIGGQENFIAPTVPQANRIISGILIGTSTPASATSTVTIAAYNQPTVTNGIVAVRAGQSVLLWIQNAGGASSGPNGLCNGATCEAATSTRTGLGKVLGLISGYSTSTIPFPASGL